MSAVSPAPTIPLSQCLVPITVAITGHRDIPKEDEPKLRAALREQLDSLALKHPSSPRLFLSGLAEGADRLAARCALEAGWQLGALLPLPQSDYENDFESPGSIADFRDLLGLSVWVQVVSRPQEQARPACYAALGRWLSRYAVVLVALWDGEASPLAGGTAETVREFLEGIPREDVSLPESGPVIQIATRRLRAMDATIMVGQVIPHAPRPAGLASAGESERWATVLQRIDEFNRNARAAVQTMQDKVSEARTWLFGAGNFSDEECSAAATHASWLHAVADRMSFATQRRRDWHLYAILALSLVAMLFQQLYGGPLPQPYLLLAAIVFGGLAYGVFRHGQGERLEARYLDYRALAEACRTQFYWKLAGIEDCAADHFLREQRDELEWIRQAVLISELGQSSSGPANAEQLANIRTWWVEDQRRWLLDARKNSKGKVEDNEILSGKWSALASGFMIGGLVTVLALLPFHLWIAPNFGEAGELTVPIVIAVSGILFALGGLCKVYQEIKAFPEQANRYRRLGLTMTLARNRLDALLTEGNLAQSRDLLRNLGIAALAENSDWLLIHRARPPSVPLGG
jgi:hypothetical protein